MQISFVLVEPKRPTNVGAAARAIHTMGFDDLRLVGEPLQLAPEAQALAHGSAELLAATRNYPCLDEALSGIDLVVGTSAKQRHQRRYHHDPAQLGQLLETKRNSVSSVAIVFGREECGLANDAIARCDLLSQVPLAAPQPSLNLAQAVMVYAYSLSRLTLGGTRPEVEQGQFRALKPKLAGLLTHAGISEGEKSWRWAMERLAEAGDEDVSFLHFICDRIQRQLED